MAKLLGRILRIQIPFWFVVPLFMIAMFTGAAGGYVGALRVNTPCPLGGETCAGFGSFWKAWDILSKNYVDPKSLDMVKMTDGAIAGMVDSLGDEGHTRYMPPDVAKAERESLQGRFEGIGAYIDVRDGQPVIIEPIEGSPAEKAGIKAGDLIMQVDGRDVRGVTIDELRAQVRGPSGTKVVLTLQREGATEPIEISVVRDEVNVPSVSWRMLEGSVAHIRLSQFSERAADEIRKAVADARAQGATSIVLDLRNNPGGLVDQLVGIASEFLPKGTTVLIEQDREGKQSPYTTREGGTALEIPLAVLVNRNSASSAEILAGALSEAGRARVIGVPTFGTATVLRTFRLDNGGELRVGTTQWLTPDGKLVRGQGITPDEIVDLPAGKNPLSPSEAAGLSAGQLQESGDTQLLRALQLLAVGP
jgi:carboxyl-terminal processing protease